MGYANLICIRQLGYEEAPLCTQEILSSIGPIPVCVVFDFEPFIILADVEKTSGNTIKEPAAQKSVKPAGHSKGFGPKDQLLYLSKLLDFEVSFSDYPKVSNPRHLLECYHSF